MSLIIESIVSMFILEIRKKKMRKMGHVINVGV